LNNILTSLKHIFLFCDTAHKNHITVVGFPYCAAVLGGYLYALPVGASQRLAIPSHPAFSAPRTQYHIVFYGIYEYLLCNSWRKETIENEQ
jgi:hypothetical protein